MGSKGLANGQRWAPYRVKKEGWLSELRGAPQTGAEGPRNGQGRAPKQPELQTLCKASHIHLRGPSSAT